MKKPYGIIEKFRDFLPVTLTTPVISLGEGDTPLILADRLAREIGFNGQLYLKLECENPTGSFKDRGMTLAVSKAMEGSVAMFVCASTGNTAASAAAYGAQAGVPVAVLVPKGGIARGKFMQITAYGGKVVQIKSNFDGCQDIVRRIAKECPEIVVLNNFNPYRLPGQKTASFEIWEELGRAPDYHFIPVGNAGNITAYWMGYKEWQIHALWKKLPKMMGYQAEGAAPIVLGKIVENPKTIASAISIGNPARWEEAKQAVSESGGRFDMVSDKEIDHFHYIIPRLHPLAGCEPASAACVAGLAKAIRQSEIDNNEDTVVVCTLTGDLMKDPEAVLNRVKNMPKAIEPDFKEVARALKL